jgi:proteasome lid subunit RPN8/RPN11
VLPVAPLRGEFLLCAAALRETERLLPTYRDERSDHEGIVFLLGHQLDELTIFTSCLAPNAETTRGSVHCSTAQMAEAIDAARAAGLSLLGQVHSHPKDWVEHSVGDDSMVFMPYENMLSIVAPWYGRTGLRPLASVGVHQYQDGRWVQGESDSVKTQLTVVPDSIDLR